MNIGDSLSSCKIAVYGGVGILANVGGAVRSSTDWTRDMHLIIASLVALGTLFFLYRKDKRETTKHLLLMAQHQKLTEPKEDEEESS